VFCPIAQCQRARAVVERADNHVLGRLLDHGDDRDVLAAEVGDRGHVGKLDRLGFRVDQDDVGRVPVEVRDQFVCVFRAHWPYGNAAIAQHADQLFGFLDRIFDQQQLYDLVLSFHWQRSGG
jgi:hypothetical protein